MKIFLTGATGLIGRQLCECLAGDGHQVVVWTTSVARAHARLGRQVEALPISCGDEQLQGALSGCDAVVNLAGSSVVTRWTRSARERLRTSRIDLTRRLTGALKQIGTSRPRVLLSASAVGLYGDRGEEELDADSPAGRGFLAKLALDWEREAWAARDLGMRVAVFRIGLVLSRSGGVLAPQLLALRTRLLPQVGPRERWIPWVHVDDVVGLMLHALHDAAFHGVFEAVSPNPVRAKTFDQLLGRTWRRAHVRLPIPAGMLRPLSAGASQLVTDSQRVKPVRSLALGYVFRFNQLSEALRDILDDRGVQIREIGKRPALPEDPYLQARPPRYELNCETRIARPLPEVVEFFERPENLGVLTPANLEFSILANGPVEMCQGAQIDYRIALFGLPMRWRSKIVHYVRGRSFTDVQVRGPYGSWYHQHEFEADGETTIMRDRVMYSPPLGPLGVVAQRLFIADQLREIFGHRARVVTRRFPAGSTSFTASEVMRGI